ncbi:hypothetical protein KZX06_07555 [Micrococcus sp. EYE_162]|uniref:hypothetical protein n=1 Tax=unclassified Micrococcus TaxID=2620948 RepID=UPI002006517E|nr:MULTISPECIES: hypothetical protein [unclassified Micrococcus]MCK6096242.1 hypothetical protein [Micrococcus sp. EYE_212]MCK6171886.1 hypothetical protein [Micrococcus sp. EYE_162]
MLSTHQSVSVSTSSVAPVYSAVVTVPLIVGLVGSGAPLAYLLALVPIVLVWAGMSENDDRQPDKGSIYAWAVRSHPVMGWIGGYCLAVTGVVATSGLAYVALDAWLPGLPAWAKALAGAVLIAVATAVSSTNVRITSAVQTAGVLVQVAAAVVLVSVFLRVGPTLTPMTGTATDWLHAVLLAVFAFWGFDAVYALSEESHPGVPRRAAAVSLVLLVAIFLVFSLLGASPHPDAAEALVHPVVVAGVVVSCVMALGSTLIPTARGVSAMAERGHLPSALAPLRTAEVASAAGAVAWLALALVVPGIFWDSIEMLSIFVGAYFTISSLTAAAHDRGALKVVHLVGAALMGLITAAALVTMFDPEYGETRIGDVGGVGLLAVGFTALGVALAVLVVRGRGASGGGRAVSA